jgi:hypothetical protein
MKTMKSALLIATSAVLAVAAVACTDVGDDNSTSPLDAGGSDQTTTGYDAPSSNEDGNNNVPGDATVPAHDSGSSSLDASGSDSTLDSGTPQGSDADAGRLDATTDVSVADTGAHDTGAAEASAPDANVAALNAHCAGNNGGAPCTATELLFVEHDTNTDGTAKSGLTAFACYDCMVMFGCLDDKTFSSDVNHECGDTGDGGVTQPTLSGGDATASCLALVSCVFANGCMDQLGSGKCYCGTAMGTNCTVPGDPNGNCINQETDGLGSTDPPTVNSRFTSIAYAGGMANALFACRASNSCDACK